MTFVECPVRGFILHWTTASISNCSQKFYFFLLISVLRSEKNDGMRNEELTKLIKWAVRSKEKFRDSVQTLY